MKKFLLILPGKMKSYLEWKSEHENKSQAEIVRKAVEKKAIKESKEGILWA